MEPGCERVGLGRGWGEAAEAAPLSCTPTIPGKASASTPPAFLAKQPPPPLTLGRNPLPPPVLAPQL
eukprot:scaffold1503_cov120-Isochrysis_galbana.AAC.16